MQKENTIILSGLNGAQQEAVRCISGPSLIIAGAGSGKTRVITCKIAHLIENNIEPQSILALTFTNKAAKEMKERIGEIVGKNLSQRLWMGTFHSVFIRFLKEHSQLIGFPSTFTIYDSSDSRNAIRSCIKDLQLDDKVYKASEVQSRISNAKNNLITAKAYMNNATAIQNDMAAKKGRICDIYMRYAQRCLSSGAMDFDDILLYMNILLRDHPQVCESLGRRFSHVLVDEYQDTNLAQYYIVKKLADFHRNLTVVGDDSQSIYAFRGARIQNILNFKKDYPEAKQFKLEQNYRSTRTIVEAANSVINKNSNRLKKECFSEGEVGDGIELIKAYTEQDEAMTVASSIMTRLYKEKATYEDFAILYRTNAQSRAIEETLRRKNLPYKIYAGHSFYERAEVKDLLAYLRLIINHKDDEAFRRVINVPARGIGLTSFKYLATAAEAKGLPLFHAVSSQGLEEYGLKSAALSKFKGFVDMIGVLAAQVESRDAYSIASEIANISGIIASYRNDTSIESQTKLQNVEELLNSIKEFVESGQESLEEYLENVALISDLDVEDEDDNNKIKLMTVHSSKGLEFPHIYIIGMEENLFPSNSTYSSQEDIEEERRLFYVAMTRAERSVTLSFSKSRIRWGQHVNNPPSRFLREISSKYLIGTIDDNSAKVQKAEFSPKRMSNEVQPPVFKKPLKAPDPNFTPSPLSDIQVGIRIEHDRFGYGKIISMEGIAPNTKIVVDFDDCGSKVLLLKFAKIRKV